MPSRIPATSASIGPFCRIRKSAHAPARVDRTMSTYRGAESTMTEPLNARRRWTILGVCALSMFLVGLDTTIVNIALPSIGRGLAVGTRTLEWIVDAYTLVLASLLISGGAVSGRFCRGRGGPPRCLPCG